MRHRMRDLSITEMCADVHRHTPTVKWQSASWPSDAKRAMYLELVTSVFDRCKDVALTNIEELMSTVSFRDFRKSKAEGRKAD